MSRSDPESVAPWILLRDKIDCGHQELLTTVLHAILDRHKPMRAGYRGNDFYCNACSFIGGCGLVPWPCNEIDNVASALGETLQ